MDAASEPDSSQPNDIALHVAVMKAKLRTISPPVRWVGVGPFVPLRAQ
jgi:hypothetical protein